jgi:hypothetical protein
MIKDFVSKLELVLTEVESYLADKKETVPADSIIQHVISKVEVSEKEVSKLDLTIRYYLSCHSDYEITRGKGGGVRKKGAVNTKAKTKTKSSNEEVKKLVSNKIASKIASNKPIDISTKAQVFEDKSSLNDLKSLEADEEAFDNEGFAEM